MTHRNNTLQLLADTDFEQRLGRLRRHAAKDGMDSLLIGDNANKFYLTGRVFGGYVYMAPNGEVTYFVTRPQQLDGPGVVRIRKPEDMPAAMDAHGIQRPQQLGLQLSQTPYAVIQRLAAALCVTQFGNADPALLATRAVKTATEQHLMEECGLAHERVYRRIPGLYREGMTDIELQVEIERITRLEGGMGQLRVTGADMEINMGSVLAGDNADAPSPYDFALGGAGAGPALPVGADGTVLRPGMAVMVDTNGDFNGYMTDMTRTFSVGRLAPEAYAAHQLSRDICARLAQMAVPGTPCSDLYNEAARMVAAAGLQHVFMGHALQAAFVGHGVGITINEWPVLSPRSKHVIEAGNVLAIEPKFVLSGIGAVGIENTYIVQERGDARCITNAPEEIIDLEA